MTAINNSKTYGSTSAPLEKVICTTSTLWIIKVIKKICCFVKKIFSYFVFWRHKPKKIAFIPKLEAVNQIKTSNLNNVKNKYLCQDVILYQPNSVELNFQENSQFKPLDSSLIAFKNCLTLLSNNVIHLLVEKLESKTLPFAKNKSFQNISKSFEPFLKNKLSHSKHRIISNLEKIIFDANNLHREEKLFMSLSWILKNNTLALENLNQKYSDSFTLKFISNPKIMLPELHSNQDKEQFFIEFEEILNELLLEKEKNLFNFLKTNLSQDIRTLALQCVKKNCNKINHIFISKITTLLSKIDFKDLIGKIILTFTEHIKNYISVEKKVKDSNIESPQKDSEFFHFYSNEKNTHPKIKETFSNISTNYRKRYQAYKEKELFKNIFNKIESFFLQKEEYKHLVELIIHKIELPKEINKFLKNFSQLFSFTYSSKVNVKEDFFKIMSSMVKKNLSIIIKKQIHKTLYFHVHQFYKKFTSQQEIFSLLGNSIIPSMSEKLLLKHIHNVILHHLNELNELLCQIRENPEKRLISKLKEKIYDLTKKESHFFNFDKYHISFEILCKTHLDEIIDLILSSFTSENFKKSSIKEILTSLFFTPSLETDDRMSELFLSLIFDLGEFGGTFSKKIAACGKNQINEILGSSIYPFIKHKYQIVDLLLESLDQKFGSLEKIKEFFKTKESRTNKTMSSTLNQKNLSLEITKVSSILHDMAMEGVRASSNWLTVKMKRKVVSSYIGADSSKIENAFISIFNKLFSKEYVNANLILKITDLFVDQISSTVLAC